MASKSLTFDIFGRDRTASKAIQGVGHSASGLTKIFAGVGAAIAAAFAVTRIVSFAKTTVTEFAAAEASQAKLSDAFARFPALIGANQNALINLNKELQKKTRFDDDALAAGQAQLAQYGLTEAQLEQLTPLLADYAAKTGKDIVTASEDLGKAFLGSGRALKLIGIDFQDAGSVAANFDQIVAALSAQVGGFAEKDAKTLTGQLEVLKNAFGEVKEATGSIFAPAVGLLAQTINDKLLPVLADLVDKYGPEIEDFFTGAAGVAGDWIDRVGDALSDGSIKDNLPIIATAFGALGQVLMQEGVIDALAKLATEVLPPLVDLLIALTPLIPPLAAVLTAVLVPAVQLATTFIEGMSALWSGDADKQKSWIESVLSLPGPIGDAFSQLARNVVSVINIVVDAVNGIMQAWKNFLGVLGMKISVPILPHASLAGLLGGGAYKPSGSGGTTRVAGGGRYAKGGYFESKSGGYPAIIGEGSDDEIAMPLNAGVYGRVGAGIAQALGSSAGGSGTTIEIHLTGTYAGTKNDLAKTIRQVIVDGRKTGAIPAGAF